jgi:hypothetical protein
LKYSTNKIIDLTPLSEEPLTNTRVYIEWDKKEQKKRYDHCITLNKENLKNGFYDYYDYLYYNKRYKKRRCFSNSYAYWIHNPNSRIVCGSMGWKTEPGVVMLDYGG